MFVTHDGVRYAGLKVSEAHYESIILQLAPHLFPGWEAIRWKRRVFTPDGRGVEPDMLLLSRDSYDWAVVEVELDHHSVGHHIADQLDRLATARYGLDLLAPMVAAGVVEDSAREYLSRRPGFLCIVDGGSARIADCCQACGFDIGVLIPHVNQFNEPAIMIRTLPGQYREVARPAVADFVFRRSAEAMFGRQLLVVPEEFPSVDEFSLRSGEHNFVVRMISMSGKRIVFAPVEMPLNPSVDEVTISAIDIDRAVFELARD